MGAKAWGVCEKGLGVGPGGLPLQQTGKRLRVQEEMETHGAEEAEKP
jgi:hypothetical protein